jgi:branched-chain amino acid transport system permease protein
VDIFFQQILNGLVLGSIYALIALGYTMVYGIMGLINFAHGEVVMIGAMVCITVVSTLMHSGVDLPGWAIVLIGTLVAIRLRLAGFCRRNGWLTVRCVALSVWLR